MRNEDAPVYLNASDDPEMEAAMKRARQTFRYFWRELSWEHRRIVPGLDLACVKVAFSDPPDHVPASRPAEAPNVEQMWINDVNFDGKIVTGTLINQPEWLVSVHEGDDVKITPKQVSDWMYAINESVYGAYTVNLMRARMGRGERSQHDAAWGLNFGDPDTIELVPHDYLGKKKKGFLGKLLGGSDEPVKPAEVAAVEHPMAENMADSLAEFLQEDPANAAATDDFGMTILHQLALAGSAVGVDTAIRNGADPTLKTANGMTPLDLAKCLGWKKVVETLAAHGVT